MLVPLLLVVGARLQAQTVTGDSDQEFGTIFRGGTASISYSSSAAAQFRVTGRKNRDVRLTVTCQDLARHHHSMDLSLSNSDCAYSTDGGSTWYTFQSGTLYEDTTFPTGGGGGNESTIYVRIGGSTSASTSQHRGTYTGSITLSADYLTNNNGNGNGGNGGDGGDDGDGHGHGHGHD